MSTVASVGATLRIWLKIPRMTLLWPMISGKSSRASTLESRLVTCSKMMLNWLMSSAFWSTALWSWDFGKAGRFSASRMNFLMGRRMSHVTNRAHRKVNSAMPIPQVLSIHGVSTWYFV